MTTFVSVLIDDFMTLMLFLLGLLWTLMLFLLGLLWMPFHSLYRNVYPSTQSLIKGFTLYRGNSNNLLTRVYPTSMKDYLNNKTTMIVCLETEQQNLDFISSVVWPLKVRLILPLRTNCMIDPIETRTEILEIKAGVLQINWAKFPFLKTIHLSVTDLDNLFVCKNLELLVLNIKEHIMLPKWITENEKIVCELNYQNADAHLCN